MQILDGGRTFDRGNAPATIRFGEKEIANFCKDKPAQTILGAEQKAWFLERLRTSQATWKIWGNTTATLDMRADPQNLPRDVSAPWPGAGYAGFGGGDHSTAYVERAEIYDLCDSMESRGSPRWREIATVSGPVLAAKELPPKEFAPVGIAFVTGSISAPGMAEALEHRFPKQHPLRLLYLGEGPNDKGPQPTMNLLLHHGVRSCLEYSHSGDIAKARALRI